MPAIAQIRIPATYMRGGTSKGVFFRLEDLPEPCRTAGTARDRLLQRVIGSPDPYGAQIDGMGSATSSTSKCVIVSPSARPDHDVDYLFAQVAIDRDLVDWSGNCGNLSAAVGAFALRAGYVDPARVPANGVCTVRIWQANISRTILAHVPMTDGAVQETGDFELDGVTFPAAELRIEMLDPAEDAEGGEGAGLFPTGNIVDELDVPEGIVAGGKLRATLVNAGIPTIFVNAKDIGFAGTELREVVNGDPASLRALETLRVIGAIRMGLMDTAEQAGERQHVPKIAFVAPPADYCASSGKRVAATDIDLVVRAVSMGKLHHAMMGTAGVAIAAAAAVPGTLVNLAAGGGERAEVCFGHPSGIARVGARATCVDGQWSISRATMSRSARILMEGWVRVPGDAF